MGNQFSRKLAVVAGCSALFLSGCASNAQFAEGAGTVTGAVVGGIIGDHLGGKPGRIAGVLIGGAIGNMIGKEIGRSLNEADRKAFKSHMAVGLANGKEGQNFAWANAQSGAQATYVSGGNKKVNLPLRVHRATKVAAPGPLTVIGEDYALTRADSVRAAPDRKAESLEKLKSGNVVTVNGRLTGTDWYLVGRNGKAIGYLPVASLKPASRATQPNLLTKPGEDQPPPADTVVADVATETTCKEVDYRISTNGTEAEQGKFESCKLPTGDWFVKG